MFSRVKVETSIEIDDKDSSDTKKPRITGCVFMPDGLAILCDHLNKNVKKLSPVFILKESIELDDQPWDVAVCDSSNVIVTLPRSKQLQVLQCTPNFRTVRTLHLERMCWGVAVVGGKIFVTCHNDLGEGEVQILDMEGNLQRKMGLNKDGSFMFTRPHYLTVNPLSGKIFVSDINHSSVTCLRPDGNVVYTYMHQNLTWPRGICVDGEDNVIVCSECAHNVQVVKPNGKLCDTAIKSTDGLDSPLCMAYRPSDKILIICGYYSTKVFKLK